MCLLQAETEQNLTGTAKAGSFTWKEGKREYLLLVFGLLGACATSARSTLPIPWQESCGQTLESLLSDGTFASQDLTSMLEASTLGSCMWDNPLDIREIAL